MKVIGTLIVLFLLIVAAFLIGVYSGAYNIAMTNHDNPAMNRLLDTAMTKSVQNHAKGIAVPPLTDPVLIRSGFRHYDQMCVECHGAPGVRHEELAEGLWPDAPDLAKTAGDWKPAELYWIIRNGIKFTAMPAWGPTHQDNALWAITAFVQKLPTITAAQYQAMRDSTNVSGGEMMMGEGAERGEGAEMGQEAAPMKTGHEPTAPKKAARRK
jgi:mono/diheme cytochrome c family protein